MSSFWTRGPVLTKRLTVVPLPSARTEPRCEDDEVLGSYLIVIVLRTTLLVVCPPLLPKSFLHLYLLFG